jgi:eukaryotic-like serine/threonine-protein kinase
MPIAIGTKIGPYEILGWLGAGGMGEVYRARDARFGRDVAIKVIEPAFAADASRVHRFEQEARAAGQLNHPNILAVHDAGVHEGAPYLVSELLEGESLRSRLKDGALPPRKAIEYARQAAEGLAAAHDKGIVHRDVKPDNLFITKDGRIKILDFGIAKLAAPRDDPTRHTGFATDTAAGTVVGTAGYMSPEQVRGEVVDARSDIFSVGTVLYEMLTGRAPFTRETAAESMTAILKEEPAEPLSPEVPPALARIIARCLEKTREARFQSARDLAFGLDVLSGTHGTAASALAPALTRRSWLHHRALPWAVAGVLAIGLVGAAVWSARPVPGPGIARLLVALPAGQRFDGSGGGHVVALSPDGTKIAYVAPTSLLYIRSISELDAKAIPGAERFDGVREPVFSPDGAWIAFYAVADQTLKKMPVTGGVAMTLCPADSPTGINWGPDGIVFGQGGKGVMRVSPNGGRPEVLVRVKDGEVAHGPQVLPGGKQLLFTLAVRLTPGYSDPWDKARIVVQSLPTGEATTIIEGSDARYVPTGHIVYAVGGTLYAIAFDLTGLRTSGAARPIVDGVRRAAGAATGAAHFSFSATGSLIYVAGPLRTSTNVEIAVGDREGHVQALKLPAGPYVFPRISPDGTRITFGTDDGKEADVWTFDLSGKSPRQRLTSGGRNRFPIWTGDGKRIAFQSDREGDLAIFWQAADGTGPAQRLTTPEPGTAHVPESWSPDGETLLFGVTKGADTSLSALALSDGRVQALGDIHSTTPTGAVFSPDGRWVAYSRTERNVTTLAVRPFPFTAASYQLFSKASDSPKHPRWSPDGKELFDNPNVNSFEAVRIITQPTFAFGNAVAVPKVFRFGPPASRTSYDVAMHGPLAGQFIGLITPGQREFVRGSSDQIQVVLNWFEDLKTRVPPR